MATDALVTQAVLEVLLRGTPEAQTTQAVLEVLYTTTPPEAEVTQAVLEVLLEIPAATGRPGPDLGFWGSRTTRRFLRWGGGL
jgi:hypothetical protein